MISFFYAGNFSERILSDNTFQININYGIIIKNDLNLR